MCACGRKRTDVVTSAQATQDAADRRDAERLVYDATVNGVITAAEQLVRSSANAIGNANSA